MTECPFALAGWTHEEAARIHRIDQMEREMLFGGDSPGAF